jgi:hypothetical protein
MAERDDPQPFNTLQMILTILGVLGGVALGAWIYASARRGPRVVYAGASQPALPAVDLTPQVTQIRALIRSANKGGGGAQQDAAQALALLDSLEQSYGYEAVASACNPDKLRGIIARVQARPN